MDNVTRRSPPTTTVGERIKRAEAESNRVPSAYQPTALPLGQTGSIPEGVRSTAFIRSLRFVDIIS